MNLLQNKRNQQKHRAQISQTVLPKHGRLLDSVTAQRSCETSDMDLFGRVPTIRPNRTESIKIKYA